MHAQLAFTGCGAQLQAERRQFVVQLQWDTDVAGRCLRRHRVARPCGKPLEMRLADAGKMDVAQLGAQHGADIALHQRADLEHLRRPTRDIAPQEQIAGQGGRTQVLDPLHTVGRLAGHGLQALLGRLAGAVQLAAHTVETRLAQLALHAV
ncbi:hypothetical protein G6F64_014596 [Rhizopus arrhizus]|uniref:Uncharacterized protein n=1 Tax=Rhizopus oryzae TaxID=64495 RepID=A0A9P7BJC5_RHIOR|nr:hypothetical protein G6F64_014596 [Rhizopus arrhizus]